MRLYALHDYNPELKARGTLPVNKAKADVLNEEGYGIFWCVNRFSGRRLLQNIREIRYWTIEIDNGTKQEQAARMRSSPLLPTTVVESKRSLHCYWRALDATLGTWKRIVRWGIIPWFDGDPKASDPLRLLRAPGYKHWKDKDDPFQVELVYGNSYAYTAEQMMRAFPNQEPERKQREPGPVGGGTFWERVASLDCREALTRLSGHWLCRGEEFRLEECGNGNANVWRATDNYSTGCFVDSEGKLGNVEDGCSIAAWCKWYGWGWDEVAKGLKELFPEVEPDTGHRREGDS